jgi:hypothetical protein
MVLEGSLVSSLICWWQKARIILKTNPLRPIARFRAFSDFSKRSINLFISDNDNAKINATLDALLLALAEDKKKCESFVTAGGCVTLVQLLSKYLDQAIAGIPDCGEVTELNDFAKGTTLNKTLSAMQ